jgi:porin-like protein
MRKFLLAIIAATLPALTALAEQPAFPKSDNPAKPGKLLPVKGATSAHSCAAFGAGFIKVEGTDTCVKIGGAVSTGASAYMGAR